MKCMNIFISPPTGIVNKMLTMESIPNEKSDTVVEVIMNIVNANSMSDKIIGLSADNTNLNFGGVNRNGINNVWRKLQNCLNREIIGFGCLAHIAHNSISAGCETLPIDFEALAVKIYKHFSLFTVRTEQLKAVCVNMNQIYKPLKSHSSSRFLSLEPALRRIFEIFDPLCSYFQSVRNCPPNIKQFFENLSSKFWILFVLNQLDNFNSSIKFMEGSSISSFEAASEVKALKGKIQNRRRFGYIPREAKAVFDQLSARSQI